MTIAPWSSCRIPSTASPPACTTKDRKRAEALLAKIDTGTAYWNCCDRVSPRLPWSGRGHSGIGSTLSTYGIHSFLQPKAWHLRG